MRRYYSESQRDEYIRHVSKTTEISDKLPYQSIELVKLSLLKSRAVKIKKALEVIESRIKPQSTTSRGPVQIEP